MKFIKMPKILEKPNLLVAIIGLLIVISVSFLVYCSFTKKEKFDNYALPKGQQGNNDLKDMGLGNDAINNLNQLPIKARTNELFATVKKCEAVTGFNCESLDNAEFAKNCGICSSGGINSMGKSHQGGLYVDPDLLADAVKKFKETGLIQKIKPTVGKCDGDFLIVRPDCDTQRDRDFCSKVSEPSPDAFKRCGMCIKATTPTFVNMSQRGPKSSNYELLPVADSQTVNLRVITNGSNECTMYVRDPVIPSDIDPETNQPREKKYKPKKGTFFDFELRDVKENS